MPVPMMNVGVMDVLVDERFMPVDVCVRLDAIPLKIVSVVVMRVMPMRVRVQDGFMGVLVYMMFAQMEPEAERHESRRHAQFQGDRLLEQQHRQQCTHEWGNCKIGAGSCRSQVP